MPLKLPVLLHLWAGFIHKLIASSRVKEDFPATELQVLLVDNSEDWQFSKVIRGAETILTDVNDKRNNVLLQK